MVGTTIWLIKARPITEINQYTVYLEKETLAGNLKILICSIKGVEGKQKV